jgi:hypothetical protein
VGATGYAPDQRLTKRNSLRAGLSPRSAELERTVVMSADGTPVPRVVIPGAAHHVMLDSPVALTATLRTLISAWCRWPPSS